MAKTTRRKIVRRHPIVTIANGWRSPFKRGDLVTLIKNRKRENLSVMTVLPARP